MDHYQVLCVERAATAEEIKAAYRRLAMRYHPDRNPGDKEAEARFKDLAIAYETLSSDVARVTYDKTLAPRSVFGASIQQWAETVRRAEHSKSISISLEEAVVGCKKMVMIGFRKVTFDVPPGTLSGTLLRVPEKDFVVLVTVDVAPSTKYTLVERDIIATVRAPYPLFVVGGTYSQVETPRGFRTIRLEPLSKSGVRKQFAGEGCSTLDGKGKGDLIVVMEIEVTQHSSEQLRRLKEYADALQLPMPKKRRQRF